MSDKISIAIDAMGGDNSPDKTISGVSIFLEKNRSKNALFNPYKNGISEYDMAYLSSKKVLKNKTLNLQNDFQKDNLAA